ncbi:competence/damage-inducible protein A [Ulvibacter litoralis]|uniref:CinA-like protein n=1 Tax=Ulvibacter litoralis TaxID=227084 RepID=A0A1G7IUJ1_9FLAO|nr:competence/damage-inducible protein A [Ulvibacter litoralis]GHC63302.1 CinA-like protein [Ulvibacter litoralis]SDF16268.1 nicotinamide-nucleotide amidase [Ulvibacter litoralis]
MLAEIITIGDEILIGQIVDTNSAFMSKELNKIGVQVYQITSVQDDREHILKALQNAQENADLVLITGGLGPTKDDITKHTLCEFFDDTLVENANVLAHVKSLFIDRLGREPLPANLLQALVPSKAIVLPNQQGTAPGIWLEKENTVFVSMPGVPYEMKQLLIDEVFPRVLKKFERPFIYHKTLLTYGMGESEVAKRIEAWENALPPEIKLAYLPSFGKVRLRLSSKGTNEKVLLQSVNKQMDLVHALLEDIAIGYEDETSIEQRIGTLLVEKGKTLGVAESCTGGAIASLFTEHAGASAYFNGGVIPYHTVLKTTILGVDAELIKKHNVVSIPVSEAMALQATKIFNSDYAIATTGIAGPTKGDGIDEVGTVCIAIATPKGIISEKFSFGTARERVITKAVNKALEMLLKEILKN